MIYPHGSPADRGSADRYYGRAPNPHKYPLGNSPGLPRVTLTDPGEVAAYMAAYEAEEDRKDWQ